MDELDLEIGTENENGIIFGDCFYLMYCGINIFFYVCKTNKDSACVYELAKKRIKYEGKTVEILCDDFKATKAPLVVLENNCCSKSTYWVPTTQRKTIVISVSAGDPLYKKAIEEMGVEIPPIGDFEAILLEEERKNGLLRYYWEVIPSIKKPKNKKVNKIKIRA